MKIAAKLPAAKYALVKPFPHCTIKNFLDTESYNRVYRALCNARFMHKESDLFSFAQTHDLRSSKCALKEFVCFLNSKECLTFVHRITGVRVRYADAAGYRYTDTDHLLCHNDCLEGRRIAYVLNFSTLNSRTGGRLCLYNSKHSAPCRIVKRIKPQANTLVLFTVRNDSYHMVEEVKDATRYTITGWFYG